MSETEPSAESSDAKQCVFQMQIVVGALCSGVFTFFIVSTFMPAAKPPMPTPVLTFVALGLAVMAFVTRAVLTSILDKAAFKRAAQLPAEQRLGQLLVAYRTRTILGAAMLEGAAFFSLIAWMLERQSYSILTAGVLLSALIAGMPTRAKLNTWLAAADRAANPAAEKAVNW
ncbi:MAG TPA: hypothetical protein VEK08_19975 [Planctomycetota bacterium]|nr:hypothetical protein [Planctomycetota bacterium]